MIIISGSIYCFFKCCSCSCWWWCLAAGESRSEGGLAEWVANLGPGAMIYKKYVCI